MAESRSHRTTSKRIADKFKTEYNPGKGVDIKTPKITVEIETQGQVKHGIQQLRGHKGPVYIAGTNRATVEEALQKTAGTTIGVMNNQGKVIKRSTRKK